MHLSAIFIKRPIATSLLMLGIALFGVIAYRALPVSDLPNVDFPTLNVGAGLPGGIPGRGRPRSPARSSGSSPPSPASTK
jgi:hydrophobic/amphiphilic exporter-1 (mainly G- bacteria), HAE1 family